MSPLACYNGCNIEEIDMSQKKVELLKNKTIDVLLTPNGMVKLGYLEVIPVQCISKTPKNGLLWYHEDEKLFIVEERDLENLSFLTFKSVDDLINNHWVIVEN